MKKDEIDDFGFSFADEDEINEPVRSIISGREQELQDELNFKKNQLKSLYDAITPLLANLKKDPKKEYIKWPNRIEKIEAFEKKLHSIVSKEIDY